MKTINIFLSSNPHYSNIKKGSYGKYIQLTKFKGVKIVKNKQLAKEEAKLLMQANQVDFTPKCYGLAKITYIQAKKRCIKFGILQEHINGEEYDLSNKQIIKFKQDLIQKAKIKHNDIHPRNCLRTKEDKDYIIDFTPGWCYTIKKED